MDLYLIRHAIAEERRPDLDDAERELTDLGRERFRRVVEHLGTMRLRFDAVFHSPWKRAQQTAALLRPVVDGPVRPLESLAESPGPELLEALAGTSVALVGHEPWMSELLVWLIHGNAHAPFSITFKKGGVAWLRGSPAPGGMSLRALLPPRAAP
jgi:phosphohistidine phosphatase